METSQGSSASGTVGEKVPQNRASLKGGKKKLDPPITINGIFAPALEGSGLLETYAEVSICNLKGRRKQERGCRRFIQRVANLC